MRERAKSGARTKTVRGGRGEGDCQTRDLSFRHFVAYWLKSSKQNRDGLQEFWRPCPSPQYFQNYKELVRKSVFCPPPPPIFIHDPPISKLLRGPCVFAKYVFKEFWRQWLPPDVWPSLAVHQRHFAVCSDKTQNLEDIFKIPSRFSNIQLSSLNYFSLVSRITMTCLELLYTRHFR